MATFDIGTGINQNTWCTAEIVCRGDCPIFTDNGAGVTVYHLYQLSSCSYISKSDIVIDIRRIGTTEWRSWAKYDMGGYEGFTYIYMTIEGLIDYEFRATYKGLTEYYSIIAPCIPEWNCELPLNGYESDGCGNRRLNDACICVPEWQCEPGETGYEIDINNCGEPKRYNEVCTPCVSTNDLPCYPAPGSETLISLPGYYKGYFCAFCPGSGTPYDYKPPKNWELLSCTQVDGWGTHGCCWNCVVVLVELQYVDPCIGVTCSDYCDMVNHIKYSNGRCVDGDCIYDVEYDSVECGYIEDTPAADNDLKTIMVLAGFGAIVLGALYTISKYQGHA